ncbi:hypothetical protein BIW11_02584 [Tropilaelaps mercedesae]|uniref:Uncharacterized protein n=1 Tax=Tropilaelaps mercedesae TaxID=418985 RepID=A0A1V9Y0L6_9ACAR|nr:hypothetical protein BIW11_02584 [Tropilaelaps mercedesae]
MRHVQSHDEEKAAGE